MTGASLRVPLARALDAATIRQALSMGEPGPDTPSTAWLTADADSRILAALRSDPEVLQAMAEALHQRKVGVVAGRSVNADPASCGNCREDAAHLLDALLGEPS